jgi:carbamate kinase
MSTYAFLQDNPDPNLSDEAIREAISSNLCRCTGYQRIVAAVRQMLVGASSAFEAWAELAPTSWTMMEDAGRGWRRVVPSLYPRQIIESSLIETMVRAGFVIVSTGGSGIPVITDENGNLVGIKAVIDKDLVSSLLASTLQADLLLISTGVEKVAVNYRKPDQRDLDQLTLSEAHRYLDEGQFAKGSMEPKVRAVIEYLEQEGKAAI